MFMKNSREKIALEGDAIKRNIKCIKTKGIKTH